MDERRRPSRDQSVHAEPHLTSIPRASCPRCGYNLAGSTGGPCPECGDGSITSEPHFKERGPQRCGHCGYDMAGLAPGASCPEGGSTVLVHAHTTGGDAADQSVWEEPGLSEALSGPMPANALTYRRWLAERIEKTGWERSLAISILMALAAGPWAILGALASEAYSSGAGLAWGMGAILVAPLIEEIAKVALPLYAAERRPYWFKTRAQILLTAAAGGLAFAAIENLLYLNVFVPNPSDWLILWRWTVCVALHVGCSLLAGFGVCQIWIGAVRELRPPRLTDGSPYLVMAMVVHGLYNAAATILSMTGVIIGG